MLTISSTSWHFRLYCWSRRVIDTFWGRRAAYWVGQVDQVDQVNLCPYIRTLTIWMPLIVLLHAVVASVLVAAFIWWPLLWIKYLSVDPWAILRIIAIIIGVIVAVAAVVGVAVGIVWLISKCVEKKQTEHVGFCQLVADYYGSAHDMLCPQINVDNGS